MPIIRSMMQNLIKRYGEKKGKEVYYGLENKMKQEGKWRSAIAKARKHNDLIKK